MSEELPIFSMSMFATRADLEAAKQTPCTVCSKPYTEHGSFPTCASHPYTPDENCQHVIGARCVGAECKGGCVRAAIRKGETP
jgi:hypothetical protein